MNEKTNEALHCAICGAEVGDDAVHFDGEILCEDCFTANVVECRCCGELIWSDDNAGTESMPLCQNCYDRYYTSCDECGRIIRLEDAYYLSDDDDAPLCEECYSRACRRTIHDYYFKPEPNFLGEADRYFGVELEIDGAGEDPENAAALLRIANDDEDRIYIKHDGSLNEGMELVSHPMTLDYHREEMPWKQVMDRASKMGYRSHQASTCGLHIHVNRSTFGNTEEEQDACIARVLYFFEKHWEELLKFSRRTRHQIERWADRYGYKDQPKEILDTAKKGYRGERYTCVNICNTYTIEFRIFRGTLKYNTLIATLQLVNRICDLAIAFSDEEIRNIPWSSFSAGCTEPELVQYLKERRLYVNEPIESEEEV